MCAFGMVILNYEGTDETIKCVKSIQRNAGEKDYKIIIVDNGSSDGSVSVFKDMFSDVDNIFVLENDTNTGFSVGMNTGFRYAKKELGCEFVLLVNSDTEVLTESFLDIILEDYVSYKFAVLGPKINYQRKKGTIRNPYLFIEKSPYEMQIHLKQWNKRLKMREFAYACGIGPIRKKLSIYLNSLRCGNQNDNSDNNEIPLGELEQNMQFNKGLHGSFLVFSPIYVGVFDGLEEVTFAYGEEWLLFNRCRENNLLMMYDPRIEIMHEGNVTLRKMSRSLRGQVLKRVKLELESNRKLEEYIKEKYGC